MLVIDPEGLDCGINGLSAALARCTTAEGLKISAASVSSRLKRRGVLALLSMLVDDEVRCSDSVEIRQDTKRPFDPELALAEHTMSRFEHRCIRCGATREEILDGLYPLCDIGS